VRLQISGGARNNLANRQRLLLDALAGFRARTCYWSCLPKGIACLNRRRCAKCRSLLNLKRTATARLGDDAGDIRNYFPRFGGDNEDSKYAPGCEGRAARFGSRRDAGADCPGLASSPFEGSRTFGGAYPRNPQAAVLIREGSPSDTYSPAISRPRAIRRSLAKFSEAEASHAILGELHHRTTPELKFSVHITGAKIPR
jgi:hypothetical protein